MTDDRTWYSNNNDLWYRFNNGIPNQLTQTINPWVNDARAGWDAVFAQEQFTMGRLTLQGALRFDVASSWFPEQNIGPDRFLPVAFHFPETKGVDSYKDITPRMGAAIDVFGNGKTAVKANLGKYLEGVGVSVDLRQLESDSAGTDGPLAPLAWWVPPGRGSMRMGISSPTATSAIRWRMAILRRSTEVAERISAVSCPTCRFGQPVLTGNYDPDLLSGWGVRASDWSFGVSVQQQLMARMSIEVGYYRRWFDGFTLNDNLRLQPEDLTPYSIVAPLDPRLPNGGGYPISGLYNVVPSKAGQVDDLATIASKYGEWYQYFNGFDITLNLRTQGGLTLTGRNEHWSERGRQLRRPRQPARTQRRNRSRARRLDRQHDQSILPCGVRVAHAASWSRLLRHPED